MKALLFALILSISQLSMATNGNAVKIKFSHWAKINKIVGAAIIVDEKPYFYGYANKKLLQKVTRNTVFGIGSITKTFVSVAILKLEKNAELSINDKITKYFPQYSKLKNVTIKELMQMNAGFNDAKTSNESSSPLQQIKAAYDNYNPNLKGKWLYSNVSYQLLGKLIEKITHMSLRVAISKLVLLPLHLTQTYFPNKTQALKLVEYQNGHANSTNYKNSFAAGGLVSNVHDLNIFIKALFVNKRVLASQQYRELTTYVNTPPSYYAFTETKSPEFGLGVFKWNISPYGQILTYPGVLENGFASTYVVHRNKVIIAQSNTYNDNDFTLLWPYQKFFKFLLYSH